MTVPVRHNLPTLFFVFLLQWLQALAAVLVAVFPANVQPQRNGTFVSLLFIGYH
jgi:hypothetical protein